MPSWWVVAIIRIGMFWYWPWHVFFQTTIRTVHTLLILYSCFSIDFRSILTSLLQIFYGPFDILKFIQASLKINRPSIWKVLIIFGAVKSATVFQFWQTSWVWGRELDRSSIGLSFVLLSCCFVIGDCVAVLSTSTSKSVSKHFEVDVLFCILLIFMLNRLYFSEVTLQTFADAFELIIICGVIQTISLRFRL